VNGRDNPTQPGLFHTEVEDQPTYAADDLERMRHALERSGRYRVLTQYQRRASYAEPSTDSTGPLRRGVFLDVETTGLDPGDKIIELALVSFQFDDAGTVYRVLEEFDEFEDPGREISQEITDLTGITTEDVRGKRLSDDLVSSIVEPADLVIAHNAAFDRPYVERRLPVFEGKAWACSVSDIEWRRHGFSGRNLEYLAMKRGFVFEGHRAINDCLAGLELLTLPLPPTAGPPTLAGLLLKSRRSTVRLWAKDSPFDSKDRLKARAYRWNAGARMWWRDLPAEEFDDELSWLEAAVYRNRPALPYLEIDAMRRYSTRIPDSPPADAPRR
jgi:DNA polymerase-3 subunit epsilon